MRWPFGVICIVPLPCFVLCQSLSRLNKQPLSPQPPPPPLPSPPFASNASSASIASIIHLLPLLFIADAKPRSSQPSDSSSVLGFTYVCSMRLRFWVSEILTLCFARLIRRKKNAIKPGLKIGEFAENSSNTNIRFESNLTAHPTHYLLAKADDCRYFLVIWNQKCAKWRRTFAGSLIRNWFVKGMSLFLGLKI